VLRTASANILCRSALVGAEGFVILPLFLSNSRSSLAGRSTFNHRQFQTARLKMTISQQRRAAMKTAD